jgi:hypothetical protein
MVWGIEMPGSFGDFFPGGQYLGYDEGLKAYYNNEMSDEEKAAMGMQDRLLLSPFSAKFKRDKGSLKPHECPQEYRLRETRKALGSLIELSASLIAVDTNLKDIIERLEPGVHQFWPIKITMPKDKEYPVQYYCLVIRCFLESFVPEKSDEGSYQLQGSGYYSKFPKKQYFNGLAISREVVEAAHLWRDNALYSPQIFLSDELQTEIAKAGLRVPKHYKMKEV